MKKVNYSKLAKPDTFIGRYMSYMSGLETPHAYDFWTACWLLSLALGRDMIVSRPRVPVYMNWYMILVAESGLTRKSTAVRMATQLAREFLNDQHLLIENKTTPETLEHTLHVQSQEHGSAHCAISISELVRFLGRERYNMQMPGMLTDLYDCPRLQTTPGTLSRGKVTLRDVFITFLSASTPSWLARSVNPDVVEGGFTSRVIFIHEEQRKRAVPWPAEEVGEDKSREDLVWDLVATQTQRDELLDRGSTITLTPTALKHYEQWYNNRTANFDPFRASFEAREDSHVLRLAGMLAVNEGLWIIFPQHIKTAVAIIGEVKHKGAMIFSGVAQTDGLSVTIDKVRSCLLKQGKNAITQSNLYNLVRRHTHRDEFNLLMNLMHELQLVQKFELANKGKGRRTTSWRATTLLAQQDIVEQIIKGLEA